MFRASMRPSSGENYSIYATLAHKRQCRIDIVIFSWWWTHGRMDARNIQRREI